VFSYVSDRSQNQIRRLSSTKNTVERTFLALRYSLRCKLKMKYMYENMPSNAICKYISVSIFLLFALHLEKSRFWWKGITLSPKDISPTRLDLKVVAVNSEISSRVTQHAGTRLGRYGSGEDSGKKEANVSKFFFVNIPPSKTVSWIFLYNIHNFQLFFNLTCRSKWTQ